MRSVIQRVTAASVSIDSTVKSEIGRGLFVLLGIETADSIEDADWLAGKIARLRIFDDADGVMNLSVRDVGGDILIVSQFTLHASVKKGNRPSYHRAAEPSKAIPLYEYFISALERKIGKHVPTGEFGAKMSAALINEGPVTIIIDTKE